MTDQPKKAHFKKKSIEETTISTPKEPSPSDTRSPADFLAEFHAAASLADKQGNTKAWTNSYPQDPTGWFMLGETFREAESPHLALGAYQSAYALAPNSEAINGRLGDVLFELDQFENSHDHFSWILEQDTPPIWAYIGAANAVERMGDTEKTLTHLFGASKLQEKPSTDISRRIAENFRRLPEHRKPKYLKKVLPYLTFLSEQTGGESEGTLQRGVELLLEAISPTNKQKLDLTPKSLAKQMEKMLGDSIVEPNAREQGDVKLIAYYLPQFHPIPENDEWWGPGFTEWTNVAQAKTYFDGHYQPHVPGELGFYDLRLPEVREQQARLAKEYGIYGFCYYYYWFEGRRLLERPLEDMFESGKPEMPFCICWANENWSRRWDGSEHEILVQQVHNKQTDEDFIHDVIPLFKDPRYIRINGAPLLIIYRLSLMPDPVETADRWRKICADSGIPNLHLCMAETFGLHEPRQYGFDSAVQFPPHNVAAPLINDTIGDLPADYKGNVYPYEDVIKDQLSREPAPYKRFPGVMTSWDNTSRKKIAGNIFLDSTPEKYEVWLRGAIDYARDNLPQGERLVFINAWNEWAEGAHLEPDRKYGRQWLDATRRALTGQTDWSHVLRYAEQLPALAGETKQSVLNDLRNALQRLNYVNERLMGIVGEHGLPKHWSLAKTGMPNAVAELSHIPQKGHGMLEQINHLHRPALRAIIDSYQKCLLVGWAWCQGHALYPDTVRYVVFLNAEQEVAYYALVSCNIERNDIVQQYSSTEPDVIRYCGFRQLVDISAVHAGRYTIGILTRYENGPVLYQFATEVEIA